MDPERKIINVVGAAIVINGTVLCAQRGPGKSLAGYWEFPGGKIVVNFGRIRRYIRLSGWELSCAIKRSVMMSLLTRYP